MRLLEWCNYSLKFIAQRDGPLPIFPGSTVRGAFGHSLKRLVCVMRNRPCSGCPLEFSCLYTTIFETRADPSKEFLKRSVRLPHPFVLKVSFLERRHLRSGESLDVGVTLFGNAVSAYPFVLRALEEAGKNGLGPERIPLRLASVHQAGRPEPWSPNQPYPEPRTFGPPLSNVTTCRWQIATPLRLRSCGKLVDHRRLQPSDLAMSVFRRINLLVRHYGSQKCMNELPDMRGKAGLLKFSNIDLSWKTLQRYSSRQSTTHSVSGIVGNVGIDYSEAPEWGPILAWAPITHVGKGTSMGLGRVVPA